MTQRKENGAVAVVVYGHRQDNWNFTFLAVAVGLVREKSLLAHLLPTEQHAI